MSAFTNLFECKNPADQRDCRSSHEVSRLGRSDWSMIEISTNHTACIGKFLRGTWHFDWLANNSIVILLLRSECYAHKCYTTVTRIREFFSLARLYKAAASQPSLLTRLLVGNNPLSLFVITYLSQYVITPCRYLN